MAFRSPAHPHPVACARAVVVGLSMLLMACSADGGDAGRSAGSERNPEMWNLFKGKSGASDAPATVVAPELKGALVAGGTFPSEAPAATLKGATCTDVHVAGTDGAAQWADAPMPGQTRHGFRVEGLPGQPPLLVLNGRRAGSRMFELWELAGDGTPRAKATREVRLDPGQASWAGYVAEQVLCMPGGSLLLTVRYDNPSVRRGLWRYAPAWDRFERIAEQIEPDPFAGLPPVYVGMLPVRADAALALYHTGALRLAAEVYVNRADHLMLFSPRHPDGLPILTLGIDQGNIERWAIAGNTLWLDAIDARKKGQPVRHLWSLDLSPVLPD